MKRLFIIIVTIILMTTACTGKQQEEESTMKVKKDDNKSLTSENDTDKEESSGTIENKGDKANNVERTKEQEVQDAGDNVVEAKEVKLIADKKVLVYDLNDDTILIKLEGTFNNLAGTLVYSDYYDAYTVDIKDNEKKVTHKYKLGGQDMTVDIPCGSYIIDQEYLKGIVGKETMNSIKDGSALNINCNLSEYVFSGKYESECGTSGKIQILNHTIDKTIKDFDEVYSNGFIKALDYYNENINDFDKNEKEIYENKLIAEYKRIAIDLLDEYDGNPPKLYTAFTPMYPCLDDKLYDFYKFTTNEFNIKYFLNNQPEVLPFCKSISEHQLFTLAMSIWADSGNLEPMEFVPVVRPELYNKFCNLIQAVNDDSLPYLPNMEFDNIEKVINKGYPIVLMHDIEEIMSFKGKETWKTNLLLPVEFVEKDVNITKSDDSINENENEVKPEVSLKGYDNEKLYSEDNEFNIDYSKYSLVIVPMQESKNKDRLQDREVNITSTGKESNCYFSVFGSLMNVKAVYIKNGFDDSEQHEEVFIADKIENENVTINVELPNDSSSIIVSGVYQFQSSLEEIVFSLDDMRDSSSYKILIVDAYSFPDSEY